MKTIVILGAGGFAREVFFHLNSVNANFVFVDDFTNVEEIIIHNKSYKVIKNWNFESFKNAEFIIGVGNPEVKKTMVEKALENGLKPMKTFVHPKALVQDADIGVGGIITAGCIITTNVKIGDYVILNLNCTVGHDAIINDYVTANPGCHISGNTIIGKYSSLGTGTVVREKIFISENIITGAQAAVVKDLTEKGVYVGTPAKKIT
jgi:sugar O-acyltransferase (sialic acid O-acetyltransferase NeuD family)